MTIHTPDPSSTWCEAPFRALLEAVPDAMVIVDRHGRIVLVNALAETLFGFDRSDMLGEPVEMLVPSRLRDAHQHARGDYQRDARPRPMGAGLRLFGRRRNGSEFPVEISLSPLETPAGAFMVATVRDISLADQRTHFALRAARMGVWEFELATERVTWSPTMAQVFGLASAEAPKTRQELLALIHPDHRVAVAESVAKAIQGEEYEIEFRTCMTDRDEIWIAGRAHILRNAAGEPERLIGVGMDITARKRLEARLAAETAERIHAESVIAEQRLRVLKATMRTVQDIVNNALNGIALFRSEADGVLPETSLALLDELVLDTAKRLQMLGALESTPETELEVGVGIDYLHPVQ